MGGRGCRFIFSDFCDEVETPSVQATDNGTESSGAVIINTQNLSQQVIIELLTQKLNVGESKFNFTVKLKRVDIGKPGKFGEEFTFIIGSKTYTATLEFESLFPNIQNGFTMSPNNSNIFSMTYIGGSGYSWSGWRFKIKLECDVVYEFFLKNTNGTTTRIHAYNVSVVVNGSYIICLDLNPGIQPQNPVVFSCPRIFIAAQTDYFGGGNLSQVVFRVLNNDGVISEYTRYPPLTPVVKGNECTLIDKAENLSNKDNISAIHKRTLFADQMGVTHLIRRTLFADQMGVTHLIFSGIILYGMLRLFLWFLVEDKWDIKILLRRNTTKFFSSVGKSPYRCVLEAFTDPSIKGFDRFFKY